MKGETVDEIVGFARAMRERATPVRPSVRGYIDTCGTGGDGLHTFNISTTTAFVVAGAGVPVAKHGNRAVSSAAGSADVLEALGIDVSSRPCRHGASASTNAASDSCSPSHCTPACATPAGPRREIGIRTVFNILGPLTNPAGAKRQLLGVYDPRLAPVMAEVAGTARRRARARGARASGDGRGVGVGRHERRRVRPRPGGVTDLRDHARAGRHRPRARSPTSPVATPPRTPRSFGACLPASTVLAATSC